MTKKPNWNPPVLIYICIAVLLFIAAAHMPYGYYIFLRIAVCGLSAVIAYQNFILSEGMKSPWPWFFSIAAIVFNPFMPIHLGKEIWMVVDISLGCVFGYLAYQVRDD